MGLCFWVALSSGSSPDSKPEGTKMLQKMLLHVCTWNGRLRQRLLFQKHQASAVSIKDLAPRTLSPVFGAWTLATARLLP